MNSRTKKPNVSLGNNVELESSAPSTQSDALNHSGVAVRTLYFHTGTHKTGSTALQAYLAANKELLGKAGISYVFPSGENQKMGNGHFYFYGQIFERKLSDNQLEELVEFYLAGRTVAICSTEAFTRFTFQEWQQVKKTCQRLQVQPKFIIFVRDIVPFYYSYHSQTIKVEGNHTSIEEFCKHNRYLSVLESLKCLLDVFGRESISVIHYESAIGHIDTAFMKVVGLSPENYDSSPLKRVVNRSLTEYEQEIFSRINKSTGQQYSIELSNLLMNQHPNISQTKHFSQDIIDILRERHSIDVDWLNQTFFDCADFVKITDNLKSNNFNNALSTEERQAIDRDVANWVISKLELDQNKTVEYITDRLLAIDWENSSNTVIPASFDPIAYLLLNLDVLKANLPPYKHFINSGQFENRRWKWPNR